jgi:alpha-1,2-mannosyltransferase
MTALTVMEVTPPEPAASRRPSVAQVILVSAVASLIWLRWGGIRKGIWVDLQVYAGGAGAVMRHLPLYSVSVDGLPFTYPPFAAVLFVPLELLGVLGARCVLTALSIGCYVVVVVVCARSLRMNVATAAVVGLAGLTFEPFLRTILLGQVNLVLLALIVVDCLVVPVRHRGMLVGIATGVKLLPGAFIAYFLLKRQWAAAARAVTAFAVTAGVGVLFAPGDSWQFWSGGFINLSRFGHEAIIGGDNQSLSAASMRLSRDLNPPTTLLLLMSAAVMTLAVVAARRQVESGDDVNALVCLGFGSLLASPVSWTHHWIWAVLAVLVLVRAGHRVLPVLLGAVFVVGPMWFAPRGHLVELSQNGWQAAVCVSYVAAGLLYLTFHAAGRQRSVRPRGLPRAIG